MVWVRHQPQLNDPTPLDILVYALFPAYCAGFQDLYVFHPGRNEIGEVFLQPVKSADMPANSIVDQREGHELSTCFAATHRVVGQRDGFASVDSTGDRGKNLDRGNTEGRGELAGDDRRTHDVFAQAKSLGERRQYAQWWVVKQGLELRAWPVELARAVEIKVIWGQTSIHRYVPSGSSRCCLKLGDNVRSSEFAKEKQCEIDV